MRSCGVFVRSGRNVKKLYVSCFSPLCTESFVCDIFQQKSHRHILTTLISLSSELEVSIIRDMMNKYNDAELGTET